MKEGHLPPRFAFVPEILTLEGTAFYMGISKRTVEEYIAQGLLPTWKLPGPSEGYLKRTLVRRVDADRLIERGRQG